MATPKQTIAALFGPTDQSKADRRIPLGLLSVAENIRQIKDGQPRKRLGFKRSAPSFVGSGWTSMTTPNGLVAGANGTLLTLDGADRAWIYDPSANNMRTPGKLTRVMPTETVAMAPSGAVQPVIVATGAQVWHFAVGDAGAGSGSATKYFYSVYDQTSGVLLQAQTTVSVNHFHLCAVYDATGGAVWVFLVNNGTTVTAHKFSTASPGVAPTSTTYQTIGGASLNTVHAHYQATQGRVWVVAAGEDGTNYWYSHSILVAATGLADVSGTLAPVTTTAALGTHSRICVARFLKHGGSSGNYYYSVWYPGSGGANTYQLRLVQVLATNTATVTNTTLDTITDTAATSTAIGVSMGYVDTGNGNRIIYAQHDNRSATIRPDQYTIERYTWDGATVTGPTVVAGEAWIASEPAQAPSGTWYFMTATDDSSLPTGSTALAAPNVQRTYYLREANGEIVSRALTGQAPALYYQWTAASNGNHQCTQFVGYMVLIGNQLTAGALQQAGSIFDNNVIALRWDFAATYGPLAAMGGKAVVPGGIVVSFGTAGNYHEIAPLKSPSWMTTSAGGTVYSVAVVYRFVDSDGTVTRSAALEGALDIGGAATLTFPTLRHQLGNTKAQIEFYAALPGAGPFLQFVLDNNPAVATVTTLFNGVVFTDETLYTKAQGLVNEPPPPARNAAVFAESLYLSGTEEPGVIWRSHEFAAGFGVTFDSSRVLTWSDGVGDVLAMAPVDFNLLAMFKGNAVACFRRGATIVQSLKEPIGIKFPSSAISSRPGAVFQANGTLRIYVITPGMEVVDIGQGVEDHTVPGGFVNVGAYDALEEQTRLYLNTGKVAVQAHGNQTPEQPAGQWYIWTSANLPVAYGAVADSFGIVKHIEADGTIRRQDPAIPTWVDAKSAGSDPVLTKWKTGKLPLFGSQQIGRVGEVLLLGQKIGDCDLRMIVESGSLTSTHGPVSLSGAGNLQLSAPPPALLNVQEVQVTLEESANAGGTEGFIPESLVFSVQAWGRARYPEVAERF
jgi:hypothetical protein